MKVNDADLFQTNTRTTETAAEDKITPLATINTITAAQQLYNNTLVSCMITQRNKYIIYQYISTTVPGNLLFSEIYTYVK